MSQGSLLSAVHLATRQLTGGGSVSETLRDVLEICMAAAGAKSGTIYLHEAEKKQLLFKHVLPSETKINFSSIPDDFGKAGEAFQNRKTIISEFSSGDEERRKIDEQAGTRTQNMITVPLMMSGDAPIGVVQLLNKAEGRFDEQDAEVLETVSAVSTMAFMNSKLLEEQTRASQLLGMGRVGHDIKNMAFTLDAVLSLADFSVDAAKEDIQGGNPDSAMENMDQVKESMVELTGSVDRIKRYSQLMSDLSAGAALKPVIIHAPMAESIRSSVSYFGSMARNNRVKLVEEIEELAAYPHDEMFVFRVVQNLVSNAIKAVGEEDENPYDQEDETLWKTVTVRHCLRDGHQLIEVQDDGPGMPEEIRLRILAGNAASAWSNNSGSGWGTKIVLELAKALNAHLEIDSELGVGTTFRIVFA
ncbi:MAG: sensor histidine kinase [Chthonomonas sp.]|nr:sensor histidine kinase [Chthonomonas sp.]